MWPVRRAHRGDCSAFCQAATVQVWVNWGARMGLLLEGGICRDTGLDDQQGGKQGYVKMKSHRRYLDFLLLTSIK